jgi:hypothetical protein
MANISSDAVIDSIRLAEQGTPPDAPAPVTSPCLLG